MGASKGKPGRRHSAGAEPEAAREMEKPGSSISVSDRERLVRIQNDESQQKSSCVGSLLPVSSWL